MNDNITKVWVVRYVEEMLTHKDSLIDAVFSSVSDAHRYSESKSYETNVVGPLVVQQPKAAEIREKIEKLQRALDKQLEKEKSSTIGYK